MRKQIDEEFVCYSCVDVLILHNTTHQCSIYLFMYLHVYLSIYPSIHIYTYVHTHTHTYTHIHTHTYTHTNVTVYVWYEDHRQKSGSNPI